MQKKCERWETSEIKVRKVEAKKVKNENKIVYNREYEWNNTELQNRETEREKEIKKDRERQREIEIDRVSVN